MGTTGGKRKESSPLTNVCHGIVSPIKSKYINFKAEEIQVLVVYTFNFSNGEEEADQPWLVPGQPGLHSGKVNPAPHKNNNNKRIKSGGVGTAEDWAEKMASLVRCLSHLLD